MEFICRKGMSEQPAFLAGATFYMTRGLSIRIGLLEPAL
jgi:hypothetical protein